MNVARNLSAAAVGIAAMSLIAAGFASVANAANKPGDKCTKAGITVHVGNIDIRCTKKGSALIWVKLASGGGSNSGSGSSLGITSNASIPKVIQNWGLAVDTYDAGSGKAGVMQIKGVTPPTFGNADDDAMYRHILGIYGLEVKGTKEPQMAFLAPLGTPVISMVDGTVCDLPRLYSNDYSVRVAPTGTPCTSGMAPILFEHEHLNSPQVKVGDKVKAGQQIGTVSDYNPHWKAKGLGMIETGVFYSKNDNSGKPWHACLAKYLAPAKKASMLAVLTSIEKAWIAERGDPTLYDLAAQNPVGCLTTDDITDSNTGAR